MSDTHDTVQEKRASYHHGDLRGQLLTVVRELVEAHGPEGFSVAEAARRAGVSTAAPYKHFKDRVDLLNALVSDAMDRLSWQMSQERDRHPAGSLEAVAGIGNAYITFAKTEPGIFRLMFGLTEGHDENTCLQEKGEACFLIVVKACADYLGVDTDDQSAARSAYMLWTSVHGHAFLSIDNKNTTELKSMEEWDFLMSVGRGILSAQMKA
ncbi:TetR/AcrR family transcriptional regulator [Roseobacter sp. EG26]|uniref:TetR/AcrR family transcriptional regulator n=1 Tax=Roseobacter sp. EG26 TaxID=3412477 RepID=UPI00262EC079|nr:TetR/AcrR family transcriptional regulator [uncultured Roseobacter sp.]